MNNEIFQSIYDLTEPYLPEGWNKLIIYIGYTAGSYSIKFYTSDENDVFYDCFSMEGINRASLIKLFVSIDKVIAPERKKLDEKNKWTVMTLLVKSNGSIKAEFDYTDISENTISYESDWKEKYLKQ